MSETRQVINLLPENFKKMLEKVPENTREKIEELRIRVNSPLTLCLNGGELFVNSRGLTNNLNNAHISRHKDIQNIIRILSRNSLYAFQEELKQGFITIPGGHRVGMVGETLVENGEIITQKNISGVNFRISREIIGAGEEIAPIIFNSNTNSIENTLIMSPPGAGKTTLLRDLTRICSNGSEKILPFKISIVDERSEIAGSHFGIPQKKVGIRTDVLDRCPKAAGIMLVIRSMSPDLIVTDEIGRQEDVVAIKEAINAGVKLLVSVHTDSFNSLFSIRGFKDLLYENGFRKLILLSRRNGPGTVESITSPEKALKKIS